MSTETPNSSNKNNSTEEGNVTHAQIGHSYRHGETPHQEFPNTSLNEAVESGFISSTEGPESTEHLPEDLQVPHEVKTKRLGKKTIAVIAAGAVAAGVGIFAATRKSDPNPTTSRPPVATSSPNPGASTSTPEVTRPTTTAPTSEAPTGATDLQNSTYERADVPDTLLSVDFLKKYDVSANNPSVLAPYIGTETKPGLIPNYNQVMFEHVSALTDATPERIAAASKQIDRVLNAKYTRVGADGNIEEVLGADEFFKDVAFTPGMSMANLERFVVAKNPLQQSQEVASAFANSTDYYVPALTELKKAESGLQKYVSEHPDDAKFTPNDILPSDIAQLGYLSPNRYNLKEIADRPANAVATVFNNKAYIAKVYDVPELINRESADGTTKSHLKAFTVISEKTVSDVATTEIDVETFVAVPVNTYIDQNAATGIDTVKSAAGKNYFQVVKVYSTVIPVPAS